MIIILSFIKQSIDINAVSLKLGENNPMSNEDAVSIRRTSPNHGIVLIDTSDDALHGMTDKETIKSKDKTPNHISIVERFIEDHSGEYTGNSIFPNFSKLMTATEFANIIDELHQSGKIAIDKDGKIGWIWNPKLAKKYRNRTDLAFI